MRLALWIIFLSIVFGCSSSIDNSRKISGKDGVVWLERKTLEKLGFLRITSDMRLLKYKGFYLLNCQDKILIKIKDNVPERKYSADGQGPGEFVRPQSLFQYNDNSIAVFDITKQSILLFDLNLNFLDEKKLIAPIRDIDRMNDCFIAFGDFNPNYFARFDKQLNRVETFQEIPKKVSIKNTFPTFFYKGFLLSENELAATNWLFTETKCRIFIIDPFTKQRKLTLEWKNPFPFIGKDFAKMSETYSMFWMNKFGRYYVVQVQYAEKSSKNSSYKLLFFDLNGRMVNQSEFDNEIIQISVVGSSENRVFFVDDKENIAYLDLKTLEI